MLSLAKHYEQWVQEPLIRAPNLDCLNRPADFMAAWKEHGARHMRVADCARAVERFAQALELARRAGNATEAALAITALGRCHASLGNDEMAVECHKQALDILRDLQDVSGEIQTLRHLAHLCAKGGRFAQAQEIYRQGINLVCESEDSLELGRLECELGAVFHRLEDSVNARLHYRRALSRLSPYPSAGAEHTVWALQGLANLLHERKPKRALSLLGRAEKILDTHVNLLQRTALHLQLGHAYVEDGRIRDAIVAFKTSALLAIVARSGADLADALGCLGTISYYQKDGERALRCLECAVGLVPAHEEGLRTLSLLEFLVKIQKENGQAATATTQRLRALRLRLASFVTSHDRRIESVVAPSVGADREPSHL